MRSEGDGWGVQRCPGLRLETALCEDGGMTERSAGKEKDSMAVELGAFLWRKNRGGGGLFVEMQVCGN